jgi:predicted  nucleic acid-binding Zn-ribbon protein
VPTKDELVATKPQASEVTTIATDTKELAAKAGEASKELTKIVDKINEIAKDVQTYANDCVEVGQALEAFSWIPGIGQGLQAFGGVLILVGKALQKGTAEVMANVTPIANEVEKAAKILGEAHSALTSFAEDLVKAHEEWEAAGAEFKDIEKKCEEGFTKLEQDVEGVVGEIEHAIVAAWHDLVSLFEGGHKKHAHKALAADAKAEEAKAKLGAHGAKLADSANALSDLAAAGASPPAAGGPAPSAAAPAPTAPPAAPAPPAG